MPFSEQDVEQEVAKLLYRGRIHAYEVDPVDYFISPPSQVTLTDQHKHRYGFVPASHLLVQRPKEVKTFHRLEDAEAFLQTLAPDAEKLISLSKHLNLTLDQNHRSDPAATTKVLCQALASGELVIFITRFTTPPKPQESAPASEDDPGNRKASLGPHEEREDDLLKDIYINFNDEFETQKAPHFALLNGLEYSLETDCGDQHSGIIEGHEIIIKQTHIDEGYRLTINDTPICLDE